MKGFVPTPPQTVDLMVAQLFHGRAIRSDCSVLDPGCGTGAFIEGVLRWCANHDIRPPRIVGVDSDPKYLKEARASFRSYPSVEIRHEDFLGSPVQTYDFVIGNPPYVPITGLSEDEKALYRARYRTAQGRFDLYLLFFERALDSLNDGGRLVFITPEKFLYVDTAAQLRRILAEKRVEQIRLIDEKTFGALITYPTITTVTNIPACGTTVFISRDGCTSQIAIGGHGRSWLPEINRQGGGEAELTLQDICSRISCGVATGADDVFVRDSQDLQSDLSQYAYPTISGRELGPANDDPAPRYAMLIPYSVDGKLIRGDRLGALGAYLSKPEIRSRLLRRTCARRKPWYAFHETPPLAEILRPKILCKDITARPRFWLDVPGRLVPRHSTYYIVPKNPRQIRQICDYLNSEAARLWLASGCQRAANGFLRLQSSALKRLPVPSRFAVRLEPRRQAALFRALPASNLPRNRMYVRRAATQTLR